MPKKTRMARYHFNLCAERILRETRLGKNKKHIHADLKKEGLFDYSYVSFDKYYKEQITRFDSSNKIDILSIKQAEIDKGLPKDKEIAGKKTENMVEIEKRQGDEENDLTNKYI